MFSLLNYSAKKLLSLKKRKWCPSWSVNTSTLNPIRVDCFFVADHPVEGEGGSKNDGTCVIASAWPVDLRLARRIASCNALSFSLSFFKRQTEIGNFFSVHNQTRWDVEPQTAKRSSIFFSIIWIIVSNRVEGAVLRVCDRRTAAVKTSPKSHHYIIPYTIYYFIIILLHIKYNCSMYKAPVLLLHCLKRINE